eukprot:664959-Pelagomonas_calceolata.AAC.1
MHVHSILQALAPLMHVKVCAVSTVGTPSLTAVPHVHSILQALAPLMHVKVCAVSTVGTHSLTARKCMASCKLMRCKSMP